MIQICLPILLLLVPPQQPPAAGRQQATNQAKPVIRPKMPDRDDQTIHAVPFTAVRIDDRFWAPRLRRNRDVTVWYDFQKCEETGRISNFARAGGLEEGGFEGIYFNDSDVYKVIEGAAYSLALGDDPKLDRYLDELIGKIAAAQEEDGYLYTARTLRPDDPPQGSGEERWSHLAHSHELYNVGHLYEAAVAHFQATRKTSLLEVAQKNADLLCEVFGEGKRVAVPGHQEIEIGLAKLHQVTGEQRYLDLARFFLDMRGRSDLRETYGSYSQDHLPVIEQTEPVGHAVRAGYMYCAMSDIAGLTGDEAYAIAINRIWRDVVFRRLYLTGGIGASRHGEAFGKPYELPNASAYNETCAAIANALWNHRMFLRSGDGAYLDVLERVLYNGFLAGVSLSGTEFFYPNPLAADGQTAFNQGSAGRSPWFDCACCPVNVVRFVPSLPGMQYSSRKRQIFVHLYASGSAEVKAGVTKARLKMETDYPWSGEINLTIGLPRPVKLDLRLRIPGWARGQPVPGDLYSELEPAGAPIVLEVNGAAVPLVLEDGFCVLERKFEDGDEIRLNLPMEIRRVISHEKLRANTGRVALERGPLVYCVEQVDQQAPVGSLVVGDDVRFEARWRDDLIPPPSGWAAATGEDGAEGKVGLMVLEGIGTRCSRTDGGELLSEEVRITAVPYHLWAHREPGAMAVWLPREPHYADIPPPPTTASRATASASHCFSQDSVSALNDLREPRNSIDHQIPRHTFWDHRGTREWLQLDLAEPRSISGLEVYWFDDSGRGGCRVPASWEVLVDQGGGFAPVTGATSRGVEADRFNRVRFDPIEARAVRLDIRLQEEFSAGVLEWRLIDTE